MSIGEVESIDNIPNNAIYIINIKIIYYLNKIFFIILTVLDYIICDKTVF